MVSTTCLGKFRVEIKVHPADQISVDFLQLLRFSEIPGYPERRRVLRLLEQSPRARMSFFGRGRLSAVSVGGYVGGSVGGRARTTFAVKMRNARMNLKLIDTPGSIFTIRSPGS